SILNYHRHTAKTDQILFSQGSDRGYELASALLVDAATGDPLAPLELRLRTADAVHSTRAPAPPKTASHLDEVWPTMRAARALANHAAGRGVGPAATVGPRHRLRGRLGRPPAPMAAAPPTLRGADRRHAHRPLARPRVPPARRGRPVGTGRGVRGGTAGLLPR